MNFEKLYNIVWLNEYIKYRAEAKKARDYDALAFFKPVFDYLRSEGYKLKLSGTGSNADQFMSFFYIGGLFCHLPHNSKLKKTVLAEAMAKTTSLTPIGLERFLQLSNDNPDYFYAELLKIIKKISMAGFTISFNELGTLAYELFNKIGSDLVRSEQPIFKLVEQYYIYKG